MKNWRVSMAGIKAMLCSIGWACVFIYCIALIPMFVIGTYQRNAIWSDPVELWRDAAIKSPNKPRPRINTGYELHKRDQFELALTEYEAAYSLSFNANLDPGRAVMARQLSLTNLAEIQIRFGENEKALQYLLLLWNESPGFPAAAVNLSMLLGKNGNLDTALAVLNDGIDVGLRQYNWYTSPELLYFNRAEVRRAMFDRDGALKDYEMVVSMERDRSIIPECMY